CPVASGIRLCLVHPSAARTSGLRPDAQGGSLCHLVITALHEPACGFAVDAVERAIGKRDVPLVAVPGVGSPPVARGAPGTCQIEDFAADAIGHDEAGLATSDGDTGGAPRAEEAQGEAGGRRLPLESGG